MIKNQTQTLMKIQIKTLFAVSMATAIISTGCSGNKGQVSLPASDGNTQESVDNIDIRGEWYIENIVFSDSDYVRPEEVTPGVRQYIRFEDSSYFIKTNCNSISGDYTVRGDSITLGDGAMTEMACDNMATEDALRRILPAIVTMDARNDSVIRLNGATPGECILLRKAKEIK